MSFKAPLIGIFLLGLASVGRSADIKPPAEMVSVAERFGMAPLLIVRGQDHKPHEWAFLMRDEKLSFHGYPVVTPVNPTDVQVNIAIQAAAACAAYYELELKKDVASLHTFLEW